MNLKKDIDRLTKLNPKEQKEVKFMPVKGPGRAEKDLEMNNQPVRLRNASCRSLYEEELEEHEPFDYHESYLDSIVSNLRSTLGCEFSNEHLEKFIIKNRVKANNNSSSDGSSCNVSTVDSVPLLPGSSGANTSISYKVLDNDETSRVPLYPLEFQNNPLYKNGVIRGLIRKNLISVSDLKINNNNDDNDDNNVNNDKEVTYNDSKIDLVEHPVDPDLLMHPLEAYGKLEYVRDFILDRIGTKKTITPRRYLIEADDSHIVFHKKNT